MQRISEEDAFDSAGDILCGVMVWMNEKFSLVSDSLPNRTELTNAGKSTLQIMDHSTDVTLYNDFIEDMELLNPRAALLSEFSFYRIWAIAFPWVGVSISHSYCNDVSSTRLALTCREE